MTPINRIAMCAATVVTLSAPISAQDRPPYPLGGPFSREAVLNAPFSADAITTFHEASSKGIVRDYTVTARHYRDSQGRVRAELDTAWGPYIVLQLVDAQPAAVKTYVLDPVKRIYRFGPGSYFAAMLFNGEGRVALPVGKSCFQVARPVAGESDDERLRAVNAETAADLGVVTASHRSDDIGSVDYALTKIRRGEPPAELFDLPADYTFVQSALPDDPVVGFAPWQSPPACQPIHR